MRICPCMKNPNLPHNSMLSKYYEFHVEICYCLSNMSNAVYLLIKKKKYIVFESCLLSLFSTCPLCNLQTSNKNWTIGTFLCVKHNLVQTASTIVVGKASHSSRVCLLVTYYFQRLYYLQEHYQLRHLGFWIFLGVLP